MVVTIFDAIGDMRAEDLLTRKQPSATGATSGRAGANAKHRKIVSDGDDSDEGSDDGSDYSKVSGSVSRHLKRARGSQSKAPAAKKARK